jgi:uncharacterized protein YkwD
MPWPRRLVALLVALTVALAAAPVALGWDEDSFSSGSESQLISLQNQARASGGLRTLKLDTALRTIARWRSRDMAERDYFSHTIPGPGPDRNVFWYMQHEYDYCFRLAGENIGNATWPGASEEDVTDYIFGLFMDSDGHRRNIMGRDWDVVAVGAWRTTGDHYIWTALFADRCGGGGGAEPTPKPTAKPTPKPTPRPTPRPTREPRPTERATSRPSRTPEPTPRPTRAPRATAAPSSTPIASPSPTPPPDPTPPPVAVLPPTLLRPSPGTTPAGPVPPLRAGAWEAGEAGVLRVVDEPGDLGLVDSLMSTVTARFFGS